MSDSGDQDRDCPPDRPSFSYEPEDMPLSEPVEESAGATGDSTAYPTTPRVFCEPEDPPDTEENVSNQTAAVLRSFIFERYSRDRAEGRLQPGTPSSPELTSDLPPPLSTEAQIGRQLAEIGDDIQRRYQSQFGDMMKSLDGMLTDEASSFDTFRRVAMRLFHDGSITWGRVVALFCFGYRIAVERFLRGAFGFVKRVVSWICRFIVTERIAGWIAQHGGWRSATHMAIETLDWPLLVAIVALASSVTFIAYRFSRG